MAYGDAMMRSESQIAIPMRTVPKSIPAILPFSGGGDGFIALSPLIVLLLNAFNSVRYLFRERGVSVAYDGGTELIIDGR